MVLGQVRLYFRFEPDQNLSLSTVCGNCRNAGKTTQCVYNSRAIAAKAPVDGYGPTFRSRQSTGQHSSDWRGEETPGTSGISTSAASVPTNSVGLETPPTDTNCVDSMNGVIGDQGQTCEVFGSSSAGSFMRHVQTAIDSRLNPPEGTTLTRGRSPGDRKAHSSYQDSSLFMLPPRGLADGLMQAYWDHDWALYPIIRRDGVEKTYESLWTSGPGNYPLILMSIINICFALGSHYCKLLPPTERRAAGDDFFARAERLYKRAGDIPSYARVQYLLLFGIYLQSTSNVFQCWMTVGQAIRMAQSLGVHLPRPASPVESVSDREYKRRIWHGCVWLDR